MNLKTARDMLEKERSDFQTTSDNFETVFPGAVSAYRDLVQAHAVGVFAIDAMIAAYGEDFEPEPRRD